eukprot:COSAG06_NODE_54971_length_292_cov_0.538860_1_plen_59_part_01
MRMYEIGTFPRRSSSSSAWELGTAYEPRASQRWWWRRGAPSWQWLWLLFVVVGPMGVDA